jgi:hypothetical protein
MRNIDSARRLEDVEKIPIKANRQGARLAEETAKSAYVGNSGKQAFSAVTLNGRNARKSESVPLRFSFQVNRRDYSGCWLAS